MVTISHSIRPKNPINKAFIKSAIYSAVLKSSTYARLGVGQDDHREWLRYI